MKEKAQWRQKFHKLNGRYHQSFQTVTNDFNFFWDLMEKDKKEDALWFFDFCEEVYTGNPNTDWGRDRRASWIKDLFNATTQQILKGGSEA